MEPFSRLFWSLSIPDHHGLHHVIPDYIRLSINKYQERASYCYSNFCVIIISFFAGQVNRGAHAPKNEYISLLD